tara:strand:+ start:533 stop:2167 length:1635 start_codon:yes stop_codon:yes gene_type:complete
MKANNFLLRNICYFLFLTYFLVGIFIVDDFGISVDEEFHRYSGFYWLNYILEFTDFNGLKTAVTLKLSQIGGHTLPNPKNFPFYGVTFDLPLAFLETLFDIEESKNYFLLRHYVNFIIFFISSIFFYLILKIRFKNNIIIFLGILLYLSSPRIFGQSFYNNKDIIFLSLLTINFYFFFRVIDHKSIKNIFLFSIFSALTCATRVVGIFIPIVFISVLFLTKNTRKDNLLSIFKIISIYLLLTAFFLYFFWPYLWSDPFSNLFYSLKTFSKYPATFQMLYNGAYIDSKFLPLSYLPVWMFITIPLSILVLFFYGYLIFLRRLFKRILNIKEETFFNDFWRGSNEKKDFLIFLCFNVIFFYIILSNSDLYNGWRHLYFLHFFISYISCLGIYLVVLKFKKFKFISIIIFFLISLNYIDIIKFHPYQGSYFNLFNVKKNNYEIDYWGLAGVRFLEQILNDNKNKELIKIGVASYLPLERSLKMIDKELSIRLKIVGQNYSNADYIFNNNISEVNKFVDDKYNIPKDFKLVDEFSINGFIMYEMYKKI